MKIIYGSSYDVAKSYACLFTNNLKFKQKFDFNENYDQILSSVNQISLLDDDSKFNYLINHANFLTNKTKKVTDFIQNLLGVKDEIICILAARNLNSFNPLLQNNKKVEFIKASKLNDKDKIKLVNNLLKTYPINFDCETTKTSFIDALSNDPYLIINEVIKASNYSLDNEFDTNSINNLITQNTNNSVFDLINFILLNEKSKALDLFDNLMKRKTQPITCIQVMATQLFNLKLQKMYLMKYKNIYHVQEVLGINSYLIMMNLKILNNTSLSKIEKLLKSLLLLDYNIKNNLLIGDVAIKMLIMEN
ncbi:MAG: hypothetical protein IJK72_02845 [Mycoplasma sp.]|nr:hypothetical protein [Mycoplasma sp.]